MSCLLCKCTDAKVKNNGTRTFDVDCPACGHYFLTWEAHEAIGGDEELAFLSGSWASEQAALGVMPTIRQPEVEWIRSRPRPTVKKRAELYLGAAIRTLDGRLVGTISPLDHRLRVASWSYHREDCRGLAEYLKGLGALEFLGSGQNVYITAKSHLIYEEISGMRALSSQAFVAMWFDNSITNAYDEGIGPAIRAAGYEPLRIDRKEHDGKIDDQIIAEIRRSSFLVADFTGHRGGVYYEAGFAHGLGRRVIFSCREDHINEIHFDVRQYNTIPWKNPNDIIIPLQHRILALFGAGPSCPDAKPL